MKYLAAALLILAGLALFGSGVATENHRATARAAAVANKPISVVAIMVCDTAAGTVVITPDGTVHFAEGMSDDAAAKIADGAALPPSNAKLIDVSCPHTPTTST